MRQNKIVVIYEEITKAIGPNLRFWRRLHLWCKSPSCTTRPIYKTNKTYEVTFQGQYLENYLINLKDIFACCYVYSTETVVKFLAHLKR